MAIDPRLLRKKQVKRSFRDVTDKFTGANVLLSPTRLEKNEAAELLNMMLKEDGVPTTRWGYKAYGTALGTSIDGFYTYVKTDGSRELIVSDNGTIKKGTDNGLNWSTISGATLTGGYKVYFEQVGIYDKTGAAFKNYLYMVNGVDAITRYNGSTLEQYVEIDAPAWAATPIARTGLTTGANTYYYVVTAVNAVGETIASTEESIATNKTRDAWDTSNYVTLDWNAVSGATSHQVYLGTTSGDWVFLDETTATGYVDYGETYAQTNPYIEPPLENTTGGPILKSIKLINGRLWGVDTKNQVQFSGNTATERGIFNWVAGGGYTTVERGSRAIAQMVVGYQEKPYVLCSLPEGGGNVWRIDESTITVAGDEIVVMVPKKILEGTGCGSPASVCYVENDVFYFDSKVNGFRVLGNEPGVLNVLRTNELSNKLRPYIDGIQASVLNKINGIYYKGMVFYSLPYDTTTPDRTVIYDRERMTWIKDWSFGAKQWGLYTDTGGDTRLLFSNGATLYECSSNYIDDNGTAFTSRYTGPRVSLGGKDFSQFAKLDHVLLRFRNTTGTVNININGTTKESQYSGLASKTISSESADSGLSFDALSDFQLSDSLGTPTTFQNESLIKKVKVRKRVRELQIEVNKTAQSTTFAITGIELVGKFINTSAPASWSD